MDDLLPALKIFIERSVVLKLFVFCFQVLSEIVKICKFHEKDYISFHFICFISYHLFSFILHISILKIGQGQKITKVTF